jgi:dTDP-glucose 4,6-dehydratase
MKRVLVTGGAGFIGSNFIHYFMKQYPETEVRCFDLLTYAGNLENLAPVRDNPHFSFIHGDIRKPEEIREAVKGCDGVIHFAAESHVDRSIVDPDSFLSTNINGTYVVVMEAHKAGVQRILHVSTDEVYGSIAEGKFTEESCLNPSSPYATSKASSDLMALSCYQTYGAPVIITRSSNNFGPYQYPEKVIPFFITNLIEGKKVPLYGDGKNVRDWIYVEDNCSGIDTVFRKGNTGEAYNIGGGNEKQNIELTMLILKALGKDESSIEYVKDRLAHDRRYAIDSTKTESLGWKPNHTFKTALEETIKWYVENQKWWEDIRKKKQEYQDFVQNYYNTLRV